MAVDVRGMAPLLQVFDMPTSIRFYRDLLGFEVVATSGAGEQSDWVLLRHGEVELGAHLRTTNLRTDSQRASTSTIDANAVAASFMN